MRIGEGTLLRRDSLSRREVFAVRGPMAVFSDEGVGEKHELAHDCGQGELGSFAGFAKPAKEGLEGLRRSRSGITLDLRQSRSFRPQART